LAEVLSYVWGWEPQAALAAAHRWAREFGVTPTCPQVEVVVRLRRMGVGAVAGFAAPVPKPQHIPGKMSQLSLNNWNCSAC